MGLNFEMSRLNSNGNTFIPPDTMGAVGPRHVVQLINGEFVVFDKTTGAQVERRPLDSFWTTRAGLAIVNNGRFDPRIVYDPVSERWFALSIHGVIDADNNNVNEAANNFFVARTDTDDPTGDWDGVTFNADSQGALEFHDYPTLGLDANFLYSCTQDFDGGDQSWLRDPQGRPPRRGSDRGQPRTPRGDPGGPADGHRQHPAGRRPRRRLSSGAASSSDRPAEPSSARTSSRTGRSTRRPASPATRATPAHPPPASRTTRTTATGSRRSRTWRRASSAT